MKDLDKLVKDWVAHSKTIYAALAVDRLISEDLEKVAVIVDLAISLDQSDEVFNAITIGIMETIYFRFGIEGLDVFKPYAKQNQFLQECLDEYWKWKGI